LGSGQFRESSWFRLNPWTTDWDPHAASSGLGRNPWAERVQKQALKKNGQHGKTIRILYEPNNCRLEAQSRSCFEGFFVNVTRSSCG